MAARADRDRLRLFRLRARGRRGDRTGRGRHHHDHGPDAARLTRRLALAQRIGAAALLGCGLFLAHGASACPGPEPCAVAGGRYHALPPQGWDGHGPLAATIFFHGWRSSGLAFAQDAAFTAAFAAEGVMLVLPDGVGQTWAHNGSPSRTRDELAFMDAVRADLLARWPVDPGRLLVTGFSQGASMVWDLACWRGRDYAAFAAVSGAFWEPLPASCPGGPVDLLHLHGTADTVVPMEGRAIRSTWRQGDVRQGLAVLRQAGGCPAAPARETAAGPDLRCEVWEACESGHELRLCLHDGGHLMPEGWVRVVHAWARGLGSNGGGG